MYIEVTKDSAEAVMVMINSIHRIESEPIEDETSGKIVCVNGENIYTKETYGELKALLHTAYKVWK